MPAKTTWFTTWFDTPYYHILYKDRDVKEATTFISNLVTFLSLKKQAHILDIPCGRGRHAMFLNQLGFWVTGTDLSKNNITFAKQFENEHLSFKVADMRTPLTESYDAIFNLFTSFGYFKEDSENIAVLKNIKRGLKKNGTVVIDFLNVEKVKKNLVTKEIKTIAGIEFQIHRKIENGFIVKQITFTVDDKPHTYRECVKYLNFDSMKAYFIKANLSLLHAFGDYQLTTFNTQTSDRLIMIAQ